MERTPLAVASSWVSRREQQSAKRWGDGFMGVWVNACDAGKGGKKAEWNGEERL